MITKTDLYHAEETIVSFQEVEHVIIKMDNNVTVIVTMLIMHVLLEMKSLVELINAIILTLIHVGEKMVQSVIHQLTMYVLMDTLIVTEITDSVVKHATLMTLMSVSEVMEKFVQVQPTTIVKTE